MERSTCSAERKLQLHYSRLFLRANSSFGAALIVANDDGVFVRDLATGAERESFEIKDRVRDRIHDVWMEATGPRVAIFSGGIPLGVLIPCF